MAKGFQTIKFVMLDFDENWDSTMSVTNYASVLYKVTGQGGGKLAVVFEGAPGILSTYRYELAVREEVYVIDQVVHIPARCVRQEWDNTIKCG